MPTDAALLAQLQSLWQAAPPPIVPPAVLIDRPPEPSPESAPATPVGEPGEENDGDPFDLIDDEARRYLLDRHAYPERCGFCRGFYRHNPRCVALCPEWQVVMPFGKHKGKPVASLDHDYLRWLLKSGMELNAELRRGIERVLKIEQDG